MSREREAFLGPKWALEPIGVQEIQQKIWEIDPGVQIRYDIVNHLLILKGFIDCQQEAQYVRILQEFVEEYQFEDLLGIPRLRRLELADFADDIPFRLLPGRGSTTQDNAPVRHLLDVDIPLESSGLLPHVQPTSKYWLPSFETQAIYANDQYGLIREVAFITGTEITREVLNHSVRFHISSIQPKAVDDAMQRLDNLEVPMKLVNRPHKSDMLFGSPDMTVFYCSAKQFFNYKGPRPAGFSRLLAPLNSEVDSFHGGLFIAMRFDRKTKTYKFPENILNLPVIEWTGSETIETWKDFTFPALGSPPSPTRFDPPRTPLVSSPGHALSEVTEEDSLSMSATEVKSTEQQSPRVSTPEASKQIPGIKRRVVLGGSEVSETKPGQSRSMSNILSCLKSPPASPTSKQSPGTPCSTSHTTTPLFPLPSAFSRPAPQRSSTQPSPSSPTPRRKWTLFPSEMKKGSPFTSHLGATLPAPQFSSDATRPDEKVITDSLKKGPSKTYCCPEHIRRVFRELQPALTAAKFYGGPLSLELQFGLILVDRLPSHMQNTNIYTLQLQQMLQGEIGVGRAVVRTTFFNKMTASPADVDLVINLEFNQQRLFEREPIERSTWYEFHCGTPADKSIIIKIDPIGQMSIIWPPAVLSKMHISFPCWVWDAAVVLLGHRTPGLELDLRVKEASQALASSLYIKPDQTTMHMLGQAGDQLTLKHVYVKRTTQHRSVHTTTQPHNNLRLRVTEIQDLLLSTHPLNPDLFEARCASIAEMTAASRQWWEISLTSPPIDNLLKTNDCLQPGSRARAWTCTDILGNDVAVVADDRAGSVPVSNSGSSHLVAASIGSSGLGDLLRLIEMVVQNIDRVGGANGAKGAGNAAPEHGSHDSVVGGGERRGSGVEKDDEEFW